MKILMVGNKNSGKSTYMVSAYGLLQRGMYGFYVRTDDDSDRWFKKLFENVNIGNYPVPTDKRQEYMLDLYYYNQPLLSFMWLDYYGGVVTEASSKQLSDDMDQADAVMIFFEAPALRDNARTVSQLRRILYLVSEKLVHMERFFNVIVVITKYDLIANTASFDDICAPLGQFRSNIQNKSNVYFRIVPVSCTRHGFVNVDLPLLDVLHSSLTDTYISLSNEVQSYAKEMEKYNNSRGMMDWIFSKIFNLPTNGELAQSAAEKCQERYSVFQSIQAPMERLNEYIRDYEVVIPQPIVGFDGTNRKIGKRAIYTDL